MIHEETKVITGNGRVVEAQELLSHPVDLLGWDGVKFVGQKVRLHPRGIRPLWGFTADRDDIQAGLDLDQYQPLFTHPKGHETKRLNDLEPHETVYLNLKSGDAFEVASKERLEVGIVSYDVEFKDDNRLKALVVATDDEKMVWLPFEEV